MKLRYFPSLSQIALAASCVLLSLTGLAQAQIDPGEPMILAHPPIIDPVFIKVAELAGALKDVTIKPTANGKSYKVSGRLTLRNPGSKTAKKVVAAVYLSPDKTLTSTAEPFITLDLADYFKGDGKVKAGEKVSIPIKEKVSKLLAASLSGQYIIIVLSGANVPADTTKPIVFGPLPTL